MPGGSAHRNWWLSHVENHPGMVLLGDLLGDYNHFYQKRRMPYANIHLRINVYHLKLHYDISCYALLYRNHGSVERFGLDKKKPTTHRNTTLFRVTLEWWLTVRKGLKWCHLKMERMVVSVPSPNIMSLWSLISTSPVSGGWMALNPKEWCVFFQSSSIWQAERKRKTKIQVWNIFI